MKGWMTKAAGALLIVYGIVGFVAGLHDFDAAFLMAGNGLGYLGLRRATDKAVAEITAVTVNPPTLDDIVRRNQ